MRFVAGRSAVAELLPAGAPWRSYCWPGRCGGKPSGISCWPRRRGGEPSGISCLPERRGGAASGSQQTHTKEKGPEETLISLPSHFYLLPCERATRQATRPNRRSPLACSAGMHCRRSCRRHSPLAFAAGMQCWRSCRCNYAGIARKVAANARIA